MNHFVSLFLLAFRRIFSKGNIILLVILTGIFMYGVHKGAVGKRNIITESNEFKKIEKNWYDQLKDFKEYSIRGIKIYYDPYNLGVLFYHPIMLSELSGKVNSIIALNIFNNCRNSNVIKGNSMLKFRFSSLVIILGGLAVLFLAAAPFRHREFLKSLSSQCSTIMIFISIIISRLIFIGLTFLVIMGCSLLVLMVENIPLSGADFPNILNYLVVTYLVLIFFFVVGTILGHLKNKIASITGILVVWFLLVFIWPGVVDSIIEDQADKITSSYKTDSRKLQIVNDFENKALVEHGKATENTDEGKRIVANYYIKNVFPKVEALDDQQIAEIESVIQDHMNLSVIVPTTFYNSTCYELSGRGYGNYLNFFQYLKQQRREFLLFWIDRVYYHDPKEMKNYVTGDENIFRSRGMTPPNFWTGCLFIIIWIILLSWISYVLFKRSLVCIKAGEIEKMGKMDLKLEPGKVNVKLAKGIAFIHALYSLFSGNIKHLIKKGFKGNVFLGDADMTDKKNAIKFTYICLPDNLPGDVKTIYLIKFYSRWYRQPREYMNKVLNNDKIKDILNQHVSKLDREKNYELSLSLLELCRGAVYLIDNITEHISLDDVVRFKTLVDELAGKGVTVVYVTTPRIVVFKTIEMKDYFDDGDSWVYAVKSHEHGLKVQGKKIDKKSEQ